MSPSFTFLFPTSARFPASKPPPGAFCNLFKKCLLCTHATHTVGHRSWHRADPPPPSACGVSPPYGTRRTLCWRCWRSSRSPPTTCLRSARRTWTRSGRWSRPAGWRGGRSTWWGCCLFSGCGSGDEPGHGCARLLLQSLIWSGGRCPGGRTKAGSLPMRQCGRKLALQILPPLLNRLLPAPLEWETMKAAKSVWLQAGNIFY